MRLSATGKLSRLNPKHAARELNLGGHPPGRGRVCRGRSPAIGEVLKIDPQCADAYNNLGVTHVEQGQLDEALAYYGQARRLKPRNAGYHSNLLYCLIYPPDYDSRALLKAHRGWESEHARALAARQNFRPFANDRSGNRRLRIGYVSPDFRDHVVGRNFWPLLCNHDPDQFDITLYANCARGDWLTELMRKRAGRWRWITGMTDEQVARRIEEDGIDILVDLALHMNGGSLLGVCPQASRRCRCEDLRGAIREPPASPPSITA